MTVIRMVTIMTIVQNHVRKIRGAPILDVQAFVGIACPLNLAIATKGLLLEIKSLILWILARPNLDLIEVIATAARNIHAGVGLSCPSELHRTIIGLSTARRRGRNGICGIVI